MKEIPEVCRAIQGKLIVSCQASEGDAFRDSDSIARFARAAFAGGAAGIRAEGADDIRAIRSAVPIPIIGIRKSNAADGAILITPSFESARELVEAGAGVVALDCTARGRSYGALERLRRIKDELKIPVMADIATLEEAQTAESAGADFILSTMRGYTSDTAHIKNFDPGFIAELVSALNTPVIAEGRIWTPEEARAAMAAGAYAVIVGSAITRPHEITRRFAAAIETGARHRTAERYFIGVDLGGTNIKSGVVSQAGELIYSSVSPTCAAEGREAVLRRLKKVVDESLAAARAKEITPAAIGVAAAGWVNPDSVEIIYGTDNIPGWTGTRLGEELQANGLPVSVINDANALALAEKHFGAAKDQQDFVCITLGTGVGGGFFLGGQLHEGANFLANAVGHIQIESDGAPCTCGKTGCLEPYANAAALISYAGSDEFRSAEEVIARAAQGDHAALNAISMYARRLATGCATLVNILDPAMLIFSGGLTLNNQILLEILREEIEKRVLIPEKRRLKIEFSALGYFGGVLGAAASSIRRLPPSID